MHLRQATFLALLATVPACASQASYEATVNDPTTASAWSGGECPASKPDQTPLCTLHNLQYDMQAVIIKNRTGYDDPATALFALKNDREKEGFTVSEPSRAPEGGWYWFDAVIAGEEGVYENRIAVIPEVRSGEAITVVVGWRRDTGRSQELHDQADALLAHLHVLKIHD